VRDRALTFTGLGRDHHVVASADEGAAEDLLGGFAFSGWRRAGPVEGRGRPVDVGGVEEVDAEIERRRATRPASCASGATPNVAVPRQIFDTFTPLGPSREYSIGHNRPL